MLTELTRSMENMTAREEALQQTCYRRPGDQEWVECNSGPREEQELDRSVNHNQNKNGQDDETT